MLFSMYSSHLQNIFLFLSSVKKCRYFFLFVDVPHNFIFNSRWHPLSRSFVPSFYVFEATILLTDFSLVVKPPTFFQRRSRLAVLHDISQSLFKCSILKFTSIAKKKKKERKKENIFQIWLKIKLRDLSQSETEKYFEWIIIQSYGTSINPNEE